MNPMVEDGGSSMAPRRLLWVRLMVVVWVMLVSRSGLPSWSVGPLGRGRGVP